MPFKKGEGGRPKGSKNVATLLKEERRARFDYLVSQRWDEVVSQLPPSYIADQYMDKAKDKREYSVEVSDPELDLITEKLNELYKGKGVGGDGKKSGVVGDKAQNTERGKQAD